MKPQSISPHFLLLKGALEPRLQLFCFPFAGGSAALFHGWGELAAPDIQVFAAQPRGRGMRFREPPLLTLAEMAAEYLASIRSYTQTADPGELPFAFYGHSLGGLLAFEITRQLAQQGARMPCHLFLGACPPPSLGLIHPPIHHLPDERFLSAIQSRYDGIPQAVFNEPELLEMFLPALKADYAAHETYDRTDLGQIACPISVFAGVDDPEYQPEMMAQWAFQTAGGYTQHNVPGNHFFLNTSRNAVIAEIKTTLQSSASPNDRPSYPTGHVLP